MFPPTVTVSRVFLLVIDFPLTQSRSCKAPAEDAGKEVGPAETESGVQLSRVEAKQAWLTAGGETERAARQALRDRLAKVTHKRCTMIFHQSPLFV